MHRSVRSAALAASLALALAVAGCSDDPATPPVADKALPSDTAADALAKCHASGGAVVVANRDDGTISVVDPRSATLVGTFALPRGEGDARPEPMYVNEARAHRRVFVGDRANDRVAVFDARTFDVVGTVPAGRGVFHQWVDPEGDQLWVSNDVDNTMTVIDPAALTVLATVPLPDDLVSKGGKPHDVVVGPRGRYAYVTVLGLAGPHDYLVQYDTAGFGVVNRRAVGKDPHLALGVNSDLYVPCQNSYQVLVFDPASLEPKGSLDVPGAHGAAMARDGQRFYTTNLPGGGADALFTVATRHLKLLDEPVDTPYSVPHNLALTPDGKRLLVTHSGATSDKVTVYRLEGWQRVPRYQGEVTVGLNPFGLGFVQGGAVPAAGPRAAASGASPAAARP